jgi:hypothetical protein
VPFGVIVPRGVENLLVTEKSVSVSNLINGATRLQPVVMQLGQAAGAAAAIAVEEGVPVREVSIRRVQSALLDAGGYIMPYIDLPKEHQHFAALQRIGATGILRGEGRNVGWENQTMFRAYEPLLAEEIHYKEFYHGHLALDRGEVSVAKLLEVLRALGAPIPSPAKEWWGALGLENFDPHRSVTRLEAAVVIDELFAPFEMREVDFDGNLW